MTLKFSNKLEADIAGKIERLPRLYKQPRSALLTPKSRSDFIAAIARELASCIDQLHCARRRLIEQHKALETLRLSLQTERRRYDELFQSSSDAYVVTDAMGRILKTNRQARALLRASDREITWKSFSRFIPEAEREVFETLLQSASTDDAPTEKLLSLLPPMPAAAPIEVLANVRPLPGPDSSRKALSWRLKSAAENDEIERLRRIDNIAQTLQRALLPATAANAFPGMSIATLYEAASDEALVGGDFYDAFALQSGKVMLAVGDVAGKGLDAAMRTAEIRPVLRAIGREDEDPGLVVGRLNRFICGRGNLDGDHDHLYATLVLVVIDPVSGETACARAGAEPAVIVRTRVAAGSCAQDDNVTEEFGKPGILLGADPDHTYSVHTATLNPGDKIVIATDGITEARAQVRPCGERRPVLLGWDGLVKLVSQSANVCCGELCSDIIDGAHRFAGGKLADDVCILVAERLCEPRPPA